MQPQLDDVAAQRRTGLIFVDYYGHRRDYAFREVAEQSQRYAAVFRALGVKAGDCVAMCNANTAKCMFMIGALERLGANAIYCSESLPVDEIAGRIRSAQASFVITNRRRRRSLEPLHDLLDEHTCFLLVGEEAEGWARVDTLADNATPFSGQEPVLPSEDANEAAQAVECEDSDRVWCTIPFGEPQWPAFSSVASHAGACAVVHEAPFRANERVDLLYELYPTILIQPGREYQAMLDGGLTSLRLPRLRRCLAVDCTAELQQRWQQETGRPLICAAAAQPQPRA